jgi:SAM-dependent methyltransferase
MSDNTTRFSDRVEDYVKYRPHYPGAILPYLQQTYSFDASWDVADVGSGTGISTELFLANGNRVFAVEPNAEMRDKAEELFAGYALVPGSGDEGTRDERRGVFVSINGTAEATGLAAGSVRLIVAGQAFHWFDAVKSRLEFARILRPGGVVVLVWNERLTHTPFEAAYDALIERHGKDYKTTNHRNISDVQIRSFYHPAAFVLKAFPNEQWFDFEGLKGRLLSSSYMPKSGPAFVPMIEDLRRLFDQYQQGARVRVGYDTRVYSGVLNS